MKWSGGTEANNAARCILFVRANKDIQVGFNNFLKLPSKRLTNGKHWKQIKKKNNIGQLCMFSTSHFYTQESVAGVTILMCLDSKK